MTTLTDSYAEETDPGVATTYHYTSGQGTMRMAASSPKSTRKNNSSLDGHIAPPFFFGKSTEDAFEFINYVEKFAAYKEMSDCEKLKLVGVLLRDAAADFFDSLTGTITSDDDVADAMAWDQFRDAFLQRFGRLQATAWRDVQQLFANPQRLDETASDFISRLTRIARRIENIDNQLLQHAILAGLKPELRTHVIQSQSTGLDDLIQTARIADAAVTTTTNPALSQVLAELKTNNDLHARHDAAFQQLKERLDKLNVSAVGASAADEVPRRRVRFNTPPSSRSPSPRRYNGRYNGRPQSPARRDQPTYNTYNSQCNRCGLIHRGNFCPAANARCHNCDRMGHFRAVCRCGPRSNYSA